MHIELAPQQGNRNMEICPHADGRRPERKWIKRLLNMKVNMPELRLESKKYPYHYQPIAGLKLKHRPQTEEENTRENGDAEIHHKDSRPSKRHSKADAPEATRNPGTDIDTDTAAGARTRTNHKNKRTTKKQQETRKQHTQGTVEKTKYLQVPKRMAKRGNLRRKTRKNIRGANELMPRVEAQPTVSDAGKITHQEQNIPRKQMRDREEETLPSKKEPTQIRPRSLSLLRHR